MNKNTKTPITSIRQKAEELMNSMVPVAAALNTWMPEADALKLIHELQVHQIELELQIAELILAKEAEQHPAHNFSELFNLATADFFTLSNHNSIVDLNLKGTLTPGVEKSELRNKHFVFFVSDDSKSSFDQLFQNIFQNEAKEIIELTLQDNATMPKFVKLFGVKTNKGNNCLVTVINISGLKKLQSLG